MLLPILAMLTTVSTLPDSTVFSLDTITVRTTRLPNEFDIAKKEMIGGATDDLNNLISLEPGVASVDGKGTLSCVKGDTWLENRTYLRGIPVLTLSHFGGQRIADRSMAPMSTPLDVEFYTKRFAGVYTGGSGSALCVDPILPTGKEMPRLGSRLEFGTLGAEATVEVPLHSIENYYQISFRDLWSYNIWHQNVRDARVGLVQPSSSIDMQLLGGQRTGHVLVDELVWLGREAYATDFQLDEHSAFHVEEKPYRWGIAVLTLSDTSSARPWNLSVGGGRQFAIEGTQLVDSFAAAQSVSRDNWAVTYSQPLPTLLWMAASCRLAVEYFVWNGTVYRQSTYTKRSGEPLDIGTIDQSTLTKQGAGGMLGCQLSLKKGGRRSSWGINTLGGAYVTGNKPFVNVGTWASATYHRSAIDFDLGITTSQPDIRGLPGPDYASHVIHTVQGDLGYRFRPYAWLTTAVDGYVKAKDHLPSKVLDATVPVWDSSTSDRMVAAGINGTLDLRMFGRFRFMGTAYYSKAAALGDNNAITHPRWDIPWETKGTLSFTPAHNGLFVFFTGTAMAGMFYPELEQTNGNYTWTESMRQGANLTTFDAQVEYRTSIDRSESHIAQFVVYIAAKNFYRRFFGPKSKEFNNDDLPPYYLANTVESFNPGYDMSIGVRFHFRF